MTGNRVLPPPLNGVAVGTTRPVLFPKAGPPLHAMVTAAGIEQRADAAYDWDGRRRGSAEFVLLQHTLAGRGNLEYEGKRCIVEAGQTMLLHFPHDNRYWVDAAAGGREGGWRFFWLCMNGGEVLRAWRTAEATLGPIVTLSDGALGAAAEACAAVLRGEVGGAGHASALAYTVAMRVLDDAVAAAPALRGPREPALQRAIDLCRTRLTHGNLDVDALADAAGYSRWHFSRLFSESEGMPPGEFILRERMKEAVRLLQETDEPVKAIAGRCGFTDANYFAKAFRRVYRVSPSEFRDSGMYRT